MSGFFSLWCDGDASPVVRDSDLYAQIPSDGRGAPLLQEVEKQMRSLRQSPVIPRLLVGRQCQRGQKADEEASQRDFKQLIAGRNAPVRGE